jgi:hypothetical protein
MHCLHWDQMPKRGLARGQKFIGPYDLASSDSARRYRCHEPSLEPLALGIMDKTIGCDLSVSQSADAR